MQLVLIPFQFVLIVQSTEMEINYTLKSMIVSLTVEWIISQTLQIMHVRCVHQIHLHLMTLPLAKVVETNVLFVKMIMAHLSVLFVLPQQFLIMAYDYQHDLKKDL